MVTDSLQSLPLGSSAGIVVPISPPAVALLACMHALHSQLRNLTTAAGKYTSSSLATSTMTEPTGTSIGRRKRRWGDAGSVGESANIPAVGDGGVAVGVGDNAFENGNGNAPPLPTSVTATANPPPPHAHAPTANSAGGGDAMARAAASIRERLAALKARTASTSLAAAGGSATATVGIGASTVLTTPMPIQMNINPTTNTTTTSTHDNENNETSHKKKKAKIFELDMSSTAPTRLLERKQRREERLRGAEQHQQQGEAGNNSTQPKEIINPYLAHNITASLADGGKRKKRDALSKKNMQQTQQQHQQEEEEMQLLDTRLSAPQKSRPKSRPIHFVEPGTYVALGEKKRFIAMKAEESGYISGRKVGNVVKSVGMGGGTDATTIETISFTEGTTTTEASYYGSSEAGGKSIIEQRLPPRHDAPEIELEEYAPKKRILTSVSDVNVEQNDDAILNAIQDAMSAMPYAVEWWDAELLPSKLRKELAEEEGKAIASRARKQQPLLGNKTSTSHTTTTNSTTPTMDAMVEDGTTHQTSAAVATFRTRADRQAELIAKCYKMASISHSKSHIYIQHPVPILTPAQLAAREALKNKPPTLHLTKAEQKRHRKLRRAERLREQQDLQAAGLIPPPEPRLTLSNYMKVLGDQAVIDPSKMEAVVMSQIQGRKLKHDQMNAERKLTKEQKSAKHAKKLQEDTTQSVHVALFYVKDMSHPYHRTKVDLNAQQNGITGGVLECISGNGEGGGGSSSSLALVIAEGGEKAVKRYVRLMTVRMKWKGEEFYEYDDDDNDYEMDHVGQENDEDDDDDDDDDGGNERGTGGDTTAKNTKKERKKFNPNNECELIWSGMAVKRAFHTFMFQSAESTIVARKILEAKGVAHYWDLVLDYAEGKF